MKIRFVLAILVFIVNKLFCQVPMWVYEKDVVFPTNQYISAIGYGNTQQEAREDALASLSLYFDTTVKVENEFRQSIQSQSNYVYKNQSSLKDIKTSSDTNFYAVEFTEFIYGKDNQQGCICAYINREKSANFYLQQVKNLSEKLSNKFYSLNENDFLVYLALQKTQSDIKDLEKNISFIKLLWNWNENEIQKYSSIVKEIRTKQNNLKKQLLLSINVENDRNNVLYGTIHKVFREKGFTILKENTSYLINISVSCYESENERGFFVTPDIYLSIEYQGEEIYSYSKTYEKIGHKNISGAYDRAYIHIQKDLRDNLFSSID